MLPVGSLDDHRCHLFLFPAQGAADWLIGHLQGIKENNIFVACVCMCVCFWTEGKITESLSVKPKRERSDQPPRNFIFGLFNQRLNKSIHILYLPYLNESM